jgi:hypothetical protein
LLNIPLPSIYKRLDRVLPTLMRKQKENSVRWVLKGKSFFFVTTQQLQARLLATRSSNVIVILTIQHAPRCTTYRSVWSDPNKNPERQDEEQLFPISRSKSAFSRHRSRSILDSEVCPKHVAPRVIRWPRWIFLQWSYRCTTVATWLRSAVHPIDPFLERAVRQHVGVFVQTFATSGSGVTTRWRIVQQY